MAAGEVGRPTGPDAVAPDPRVIAIVGYEEGGAGEIQAWLEAHLGVHVACFINPSDTPPRIDSQAPGYARDASQYDYPTATSFKGRPLISRSDWTSALVEQGIDKVLITVSDKRARLALIAAAREAGLELINAIHPTALIMEDAILGQNVIILARVVVGYRAEIHDGAVLHIGTQVDHHGVVRPGAAVGPAAILAGNVTVGSCAHVFAGAVVKNRVRIGDDAVVGAGAVVIRDVPPNVTVVGVPAHPMGKEAP